MNEGDAVVHEVLGRGKIIVYLEFSNLLIEFDDEITFGHNGDGAGKDGHCWWCGEDDLTTDLLYNSIW